MVHLRRIAGREELIASPSQVAQWVRSACRDRLEARRKLLRPTQPPPPTEMEAPPVPPFETAQAEQRTLSRPPSSYATREKTEAIPSQPPVAAAFSAAPAPVAAAPRATHPPQAFVPPAESVSEPPPFGMRKITYYIAISGVLLVLVGVVFAPEWLSSLFSLGEKPAAAGAPAPIPVRTEPSVKKPKSESEVVIPEIRPAGK